MSGLGAGVGAYTTETRIAAKGLLECVEALEVLPLEVPPPADLADGAQKGTQCDL